MPATMPCVLCWQTLACASGEPLCLSGRVTRLGHACTAAFAGVQKPSMSADCTRSHAQLGAMPAAVWATTWSDPLP